LDKLEHYDFERIMYCLYKSELAHTNCLGYQSIQLMSGVRDNGRDCTLYANDRIVAIIQCKHSARSLPVSEALCAKEIIKYCLYALRDSSLLPNIHSFTYFFTASAGFDTKATSLMKSFNSNMPVHKSIENWTKQVINSTQFLKDMQYQDVRERLNYILSHLKVQVIVPTDIELLLSKEYNSNIIAKFFEVRLVSDNAPIQHLQRSVDALLLKKQPPVSKILKEFTAASSYLAELKSSFSLDGSPQLNRKITASLLSWIKSPVKEDKNIAILRGQAGSGKSVILNHLFHSLQENQMPVIALKADVRKADSVASLEKKFGLSSSLMDSIDILACEHERIIVIIDQIDALSQTLSANRDTLRTYTLLINKLKAHPQIRVIVSAREYDLNYDADLVPLKKYDLFEAGILEIEEVKHILEMINVSGYNEKLLRLLQVPLHLELFC
ncbi:MAG TPA: hypothetical protein VK616_06365, partial [Flavitalea sp.]|nr:hypothetical protein [Flavitalea sp.]